MSLLLMAAPGWGGVVQDGLLDREPGDVMWRYIGRDGRDFVAWVYDHAAWEDGLPVQRSVGSAQQFEDCARTALGDWAERHGVVGIQAFRDFFANPGNKPRNVGRWEGLFARGGNCRRVAQLTVDLWIWWMFSDFDVPFPLPQRTDEPMQRTDEPIPRPAPRPERRGPRAATPPGRRPRNRRPDLEIESPARPPGGPPEGIGPDSGGGSFPLPPLPPLPIIPLDLFEAGPDGVPEDLPIGGADEEVDANPGERGTTGEGGDRSAEGGGDRSAEEGGDRSAEEGGDRSADEDDDFHYPAMYTDEYEPGYVWGHMVDGKAVPDEPKDREPLDEDDEEDEDGDDEGTDLWVPPGREPGAGPIQWLDELFGPGVATVARYRHDPLGFLRILP